MQIYLVVEPPGSPDASCVVTADSLDQFRHVLKPGVVVYTLGAAHPRTPPGTLARVSEVGELVEGNCIREVIGTHAE